jgi:hypothetical protein
MITCLDILKTSNKNKEEEENEVFKKMPHVDGDLQYIKSILSPWVLWNG